MSVIRRRTYSLLGGWLMNGEVLYCGLNDEVSEGYVLFHLTDKNISDYFNDNYALWVGLTRRRDYLETIDDFVAVYSDFTKDRYNNNEYYLYFKNSNYEFIINLDDNSCKCKYSGDESIGEYNLLLIAIPRTDV